MTFLTEVARRNSYIAEERLQLLFVETLRVAIPHDFVLDQSSSRQSHFAGVPPFTLTALGDAPELFKLRYLQTSSFSWRFAPLVFWSSVRGLAQHA